jgi:hypothetical protein
MCRTTSPNFGWSVGSPPPIRITEQSPRSASVSIVARTLSPEYFGPVLITSSSTQWPQAWSQAVVRSRLIDTSGIDVSFSLEPVAR